MLFILESRVTRSNHIRFEKNRLLYDIFGGLNIRIYQHSWLAVRETTPVIRNHKIRHDALYSLLCTVNIMDLAIIWFF
jgi:hypothetical protein